MTIGSERWEQNEFAAFSRIKSGHTVHWFVQDLLNGTSTIQCVSCGAKGQVNHEGLGPVGLIFVETCEEVRKVQAPTTVAC